MFKFDFVQDGDDERTKTTQNEKNGVNGPVMMEISFIELVSPLRLQTPKTMAFIPFAVGYLASPHFLLPTANTIIGGPPGHSPLPA